ncbi:MAG TPA: DNRLRE domain-containing protein [candidate division Zixibacteria bacterium]|nr:DNRLRE domain-containing protein [candidate division Zixibacteria bacterium]
MIRVITAVAAVALLTGIIAVDLVGAETRDVTVYMNRSQLVDGIFPLPSNPAPVTADKNRTQYLWEDFEGTTFPPSGWDTLNLNEGYGWFRGTYTGGGTNAALVTWDQTDPVTLQDEWLLTPELDVSGASSLLRVEFYMLQGYDYPHDFKVYVTDDNGVNWTEVFDSYGTGYPEFQWYFVSVALDAWAGNTNPIRIGFQYYGTDADIFGLDNIEVTDDPPATGRCCVYTDPSDPDCYDGIIQTECDALGGTWSEGLDCLSDPCPIQGLQLEPSDDLYSDPDEGSGHQHPVEQASLWTADYDGAGHHERIMLRWDLTAYAGQTIDSAFVNLYRYFRCPGDYYTECDLFVATEDWDEDTWNEYNHVSHNSTSSLYYNFGPALGWYRLDISDVVNQWLAGTINDYGIVIQAQYGEKFSKFYSKEGTYPPYLELYGVASFDQDGDGVPNSSDNCPLTANPLQEDIDADGVGDSCDNCLNVYNPDQADTNSNGVGDVCESCCESRGDINHSGSGGPDIADLVYLVTYMFQNGPQPPCDEPSAPDCPEHHFSEADINGDGSCMPDISDLVYLVTYMFQNGPEPVPCP